MHTTSAPSQSDVAIIGAGLTGRLMALALADAGLSVALVDGAPAGGGAADPRTTAIAYASARVFQRLGVWDPLFAGAGKITDILVTQGQPGDRFRRGGLTGGALHFPSALLPTDATRPSATPLGYIVENGAMNAALEAKLAEIPTVHRQYGTKVLGVATGGGAAQIELADGRRHQAPLVIACDGKRSPLRETFGFRTTRWGYGQKALVFNVTHSLPHNGVAHEIFYPEGPFAILPMAGNAASIVWTDAADKADALLRLDPAGFTEMLSARMGEAFGEVQLASDRVAWPLEFIFVPTLTQDRLALAGDAAHTIHPIAGQGFNLGVKDIATLAAVLTTAREAGLDIGHGSVLAEYDKKRRFDIATLAFGTDAFNRLFSNRIAPLQKALGAGMKVINGIDPARRFFMRHAGADLGDLPPLMQPMPHG